MMRVAYGNGNGFIEENKSTIIKPGLGQQTDEGVRASEIEFFRTTPLSCFAGLP